MGVATGENNDIWGTVIRRCGVRENEVNCWATSRTQASTIFLASSSIKSMFPMICKRLTWALMKIDFWKIKSFLLRLFRRRPFKHSIARRWTHSRLTRKPNNGIRSLPSQWIRVSISLQFFQVSHVFIGLGSNECERKYVTLTCEASRLTSRGVWTCVVSLQLSIEVIRVRKYMERRLASDTMDPPPSG